MVMITRNLQYVMVLLMGCEDGGGFFGFGQNGRGRQRQ